MLLYSDISNLTFRSVNIFKRKNFLIGFLDELGNFKQKKLHFSKCKFFLQFTARDSYILVPLPIKKDTVGPCYLTQFCLKSMGN